MDTFVSPSPPSSTSSSPISTTLELLTYYSLESDRYPPSISKAQVLDEWLKSYSEQWIRLALVESLYQGRYKMISVEQLLVLWSRRGQPTFHFNHEFASLVCHDVPHQMEQAVIFKVSFHDTLPHQSSAAESPPSAQMAPRSISDAEKVSVDSENPILSEDESLEKSLSIEAVDDAVEYRVDDGFEMAWSEARLSVLSSVLGSNHFLPLTFHRLGLEPIHQFMPEAEPIEFCERLEAIARSSS
jgi:hypothetical protein